ncbi:MAG: hypothetical protein ACTSPW_15265, partial [Promethearchaeota archaeon]
NTFFLYIQYLSISGGTAYLSYAHDSAAQDYDDEMLVYDDKQTLTTISGDTVDVCLKVGLTPLKRNPKPSEIGLKINNTAIKDNGTDDSGYWVSTNEYYSTSGFLNFQISADWYDVKLNISKIQINYTKTDLTAIASFNAFYNSSKIQWNITRIGGLNFFEGKFTNYKINFTIPGIWYDIKAFNNSLEKAIDISAPIINGYRDVIIKNAGNGTWYLLANSTNLLKKIEIFQKGYKTPITTASISNVVEFNATFKEKIHQNDGLINLSIYSPKTLNDRLNFSREISNFPTGLEYSLGEWDISENVTNFGDFRVQVFWYNGTAVGFNQTILTIINEEQTKIIDLSKNFTIFRGQNITYTFNYSDINNNPITSATITEKSVPSGFTTFTRELSNGNYTIKLNSSNVNVLNSPFEYNFTIWKVGYQPQDISLSINVIKTNTEIIIKKYNTTYYRKDNPTINVILYVKDTINNKSVLGLTKGNVTIYNQANMQQWLDTWNLQYLPDGNYSLKINVSSTNYNSGVYNLLINISGYPNYNWSTATIQITLLGNRSTINIMSILDPGGIISPTSPGTLYEFFVGSDLYIEFNITDLDSPSGNEIVEDTGKSAIITVNYNNTETNEQGTIANNLEYDLNTKTFKGTIDTSSLAAGSYIINISVSLTNYKIKDLSLNVSVKEKYDIKITVINYPKEVIAGNTFKIKIKIEYKVNDQWKPLKDAEVIITPYFDDKKTGDAISGKTNSKGEIELEIIVPNNAESLKIIIEVKSEYYYKSGSLKFEDIKVIPLIESFLPYIIIIGIAAAIGIGALAIYKGVIVPKKLERERILTEVKTIFDDAVNLEHILVLYKGTGTCIFFKSFGSEAIDPELISGFLSAVSSFGREMESQQALNQISYGDKMLLLADGEYIRVALVLSKEASVMLRKHLKDFITKFEEVYQNELPNWRGQLNVFRDAGVIVDETLNTSIILPHKLSFEYSSPKSVKNPNAREVLKIAQEICKGTERDFFFIATLLQEVVEKTDMDTAEVFMGIKELRDKKVFIPIDISAIEEQPISQQEIDLLRQKLAGIPSISEEQRESILQDLIKMSSVEREAYLASLLEQQEIISAPIKEGEGVGEITDIKSAKKEINKLKKEAEKAKKNKNYEEAIEIFEKAATIASNWDLTKILYELEDKVRLTKIQEYSEKIKQLEKEGKKAAKEGNYEEAAKKYNVASDLANEIFKLGGGGEMYKEIKRLKNKAKEFEKYK